MTDCPNAEIRDQLPDLLHGHLDEVARTVVVAHVASCGDCHEELELLRTVLGMVEAQTPNVDIAAIVRALPSPPKAVVVLDQPATVAATRDRSVVPIATRRRVWSDWRVAAAVTLLVAGGSSAMLLKRSPARVTIDAPVVAIAPTNSPAGNVSDSSPTVSPAKSGSSSAQLTAAATTLLNKIDNLPAVPVTEPEPVSLHITSQSSTGGGA
jgi:negative regulator of sigma E activity